MVFLVRFRRNDQRQPGITNNVRPASGLPVKRRVGWLAIPVLIAWAVMASSATQADELQDYARQCDDAIGATVQDFDCDAGADVPGQGTLYSRNHPSATCDEPNRLDKDCDPGSHFQVLTRTDDAYVVGHCRKKGNASGVYGDIAVIQYNRKNGATCFYQALGTLPGQVKAPSKGGPPAYPWFKPSGTAFIGCGGCHDSGPFIRSPYLNQVEKDQPSPGKDNTIPGKDERGFNINQLYAFVGQDFASWKAFKVEIADNECNFCHRLGVNNVPVNKYPCSPVTCGTALDFAERATSADEKSEEDQRDSHKNPPSPASPIWMPPGQTAPNPGHAAAAKAIHDCAMRFVKGEFPLPDSADCRITQIAGAQPPPPPSKQDLTSIYYLLDEPSKDLTSIYYLILDTQQ